MFGIIPAFFIGVVETLEYCFLLTTNLHYIGDLLTTVSGSDVKYNPLWLLMVYVLNFVGHVSKGEIMYGVSAVFGAGNVILIVIFVLGCAKYANLPAYGASVDGTWIVPDAGTFFTALPYALWPYIGVVFYVPLFVDLIFTIIC